MCATSVPGYEQSTTASRLEADSEIVFELCNTRSRNLLGTYASEDAALSVVRQLADDHGRAHGVRFAIGLEDAEGESRLIATGEELDLLAERRAPVSPQ